MRGTPRKAASGPRALNPHTSPFAGDPVLAIGAEFAAETAVYDFLDDWAEVQRAVADLGQQIP